MQRGAHQAEQTTLARPRAAFSCTWRGSRLVRWLLAVAAAILALPACASATWTPETGPFPVGNLLSYANSDFEGQANLSAVHNAAISDSDTGFLHAHTLQDTVPRAGTSAFKLPKGVSIGVGGGNTYTVSAYIKLSSAASDQALTFG